MVTFFTFLMFFFYFPFFIFKNVGKVQSGKQEQETRNTFKITATK